jgi:hypothetical protein
MDNQRLRQLARRLYHSRFVPNWVRLLRQRRMLLDHNNLPPVTFDEQVLPATFNEKVCYRIATDRRSILATFVDRVAVRQYVKEKVGEHVLTQAYAVTTSPQTLARSDLPSEFVLKASHGSGGMIFVGNHAPRWLRLPPPPIGWARLHVHPESLDWDQLVNLSQYWLSLRFQPRREWAYQQITPQILFEELLVSDWRGPFEYKFYTFHGTAQLVTVPLDRFTSLGTPERPNEPSDGTARPQAAQTR